jgi:HSP20 family protein
MLLTRSFYPANTWRNTYGELDRLRQEMNQLMGAFSGSYEPGAGVFPLVNVTEDMEGFHVTAELPGVTPGDINVSVHGKTLTIEGERKAAQVEEGARYHRRERGVSSFSRMIGLPSEVDGSKVSASCKNGVLTIDLPKAEAAKPRQINVMAS